MKATYLVFIYVVCFESGFCQQQEDVGLEGLSERFLPKNGSNPVADAKKLFKEKCTQVFGSEEPYTDIEKASEKLKMCAMEIVNITAIQTEMAEARPKGELDVVFNKYCEKRTLAINCINEFNKKVKVCLENKEKETADIIVRMFTSLLNFVCYKGGDQIALFIAEDGPECFRNKTDDIQNCMNNTFSDYIPRDDNVISIETLPKFIMGPKQCSDWKKLDICLFNALKTCGKITPANIVESMSKFMKNGTICAENHQGTISLHFGIILLSVFSIIFFLWF